MVSGITWVECLESRRLLSVTLHHGVLKITGTDGHDYIQVRQSAPGPGSSLAVEHRRKEAPTTAIWDAAILESREFVVGDGKGQVQRIVINGGAGDDTVSLYAGRPGKSTRPQIKLNWHRLNALAGQTYLDARVYGGIGDDRINGGNGNDFMSGGPGNDHVFGRTGDDVLLGRSGNDILGGNDGNDRHTGGPGDDTLGGDLGADSAFGGSGNDTIHEYEYLNREEAGVILGGAGADIIHLDPLDQLLDPDDPLDDLRRVPAWN